MYAIDNLIPTFMMMFLALFARVYQRSWLAPGAFFTAIWTIHVMLSYFFTGHPVWSGTIWYIFTCCLILYAGSIIGYDAGHISLNGMELKRKANYIVFHKPRAMLFICFMLALAQTFLSQLRGTVVDPPLAMQLLLPFQYVGPALAGIFFSTGAIRKFRLFWALIPLVPAMMLSILFTGRTAMIAPVLFWISGYLSMQILNNKGRVSIFKIRWILAGILIILIFIIIGSGIYVLRIVNIPSLGLSAKVALFADAFTWDAFMENIFRPRIALFGQVYSFSWYFVNAWDYPPSPHWGSIIFAAPLDLLGLGGERYPFEPFEIVPGKVSNVFTMLRPPVDDFGLAGSLIWWFGIGVVSGWSYSRVVRGIIWPGIFLIWFYVDVFIGGGYFFRYNSIILAYLILFIYFHLSEKRIVFGPAFKTSRLSITKQLFKTYN